MSDWHRSRFIERTEEAFMLLSLPPVIQAGEFDCGDAAARVVLQYHGIKATARMATPERGTSPEQIEAAFKRIGMKVVSGEMSIADLRHFCDTLRPVITVIHWPGEADSHYVCVRGVSRGWVYYHDVADGPGKKNVVEFLTAWRAAGRAGVYRQWGICGWIE
jgi:ABC-type bacteriocin/lantibiotic exporter with double-glycine peptidase domain